MARKKKETLPEVVPELFEHEEFGQFRYIKRGEEIWFVANDICRALDLENVTKALYVLDDDELTLLKVRSGGQMREMNFVNEFGLYNLILSSRKPEAKKFKRWVTHEVLPSIRKYGYYSVAAEKKTVIYLGNPAPELLEPMMEEEFFEVIEKLLTDQVEFLKIKK